MLKDGFLKGNPRKVQGNKRILGWLKVERKQSENKENGSREFYVLKIRNQKF